MFELFLWFLRKTPAKIGIFARQLIYSKLFFSDSKIFLIEEDVAIRGLKRNIKLGEQVLIQKGTFLNAQKGLLKVGNFSQINSGAYLNCQEGKMFIGEKVLIGPYVVINAVTHLYQNKNQSILDQGCQYLEVYIEDDVWIGAHAVIMPGIKIGKGAVVGAGSIVTKDVESYSVVAGVPAKKIKDRN